MSSYLLKRQSQVPSYSTTLTSKVQQLQLKLQALKKQIMQKQQIIKIYQKKIQQQQKVIQQKQFIIQEKDLTLQHILKQNEQLHEKIFQLNQGSIKHEKEIKETIKSEIGLIKQEFNFMIQQNEIKNQIILDSKVKEFKRRQNQLQEIIKDLSEKASSNNGSFYYEESHSNIIKSKKVPNSYAYNSRDSRDSRNRDNDFFNRDQSEPDKTANLVNSRQSIRSSQAKQSKNYEYSKLGRQRQAQRQQQLNSILSANLKSDSGKYSSSNLLKYAKQPNLNSNIQKKYQYVPPTKYQKAPSAYDTKTNNSNNTSIYNRTTQYKQTQKQPQKSNYPSAFISKQKSQTKLQQILSRTRKDQKYEIEIKAKSKIYETNIVQEDKRKQQKLKQINSLKMKVNMLKSQLKQQISFCQQK